jgi:hypothetical protein
MSISARIIYSAAALDPCSMLSLLHIVLVLLPIKTSNNS